MCSFVLILITAENVKYTVLCVLKVFCPTLLEFSSNVIRYSFSDLGIDNNNNDSVSDREKGCTYVSGL